MDGRDIGTTVLPNAEMKVFLLATVDERDQRRHDENLKNGFKSNLDALKKEISERDYRDETRKESPLVRSEDAISIDTTSLTIKEVVQEIIQLVRNYRSEEHTSELQSRGHLVCCLLLEN